KRDLYAHAFALLGLASAYRATKDDKYLDCADRTLHFINTSMPAKAGGYVTSLPNTDTTLLQNPHMHLLESLLELHRVNPGGGYGDEAKKPVRLFEERFFKSKPGPLTESSDKNGPPPPGGGGPLLNPAIIMNGYGC